MRTRRLLPLLLALGLTVPAAAQGTAADACPPATTDADRLRLWASIQEGLHSDLSAAARAAGITEPEGIVFVEVRNRGTSAARVWSFRTNVPDSLSRTVVAQRVGLLACWPEREVLVNFRLDPSGLPPGTAVEQMPVLLNPREFARALDRISRSGDPLNRARQVTVELKMLVTRDGEVAYAELGGNSVNLDVDRALLDVARGLRFRPARVGNVPVDVWVEQPVEVRVGG